MNSGQNTFHRPTNPRAGAGPTLAFADRKGGFPHSEISGSKGARASPELFAACHVLHRLSTPRHPSEALMRLIVLSKTHALDAAVGLAAHRAQPCALVISLSQTMMSSQVRPQSSGVKIRRSSSRDDPSFTMSNPPGADARREFIVSTDREFTWFGGARRDRTDD